MSRQRSRRLKNPDNRPLLSVCTILILSGFLIGLSTSRLIDGEMGTYLLLSGFVGILSFIALDHVRTLRRKQAESEEQMFVEERLERHVDSCMGSYEIRQDAIGSDTEELSAMTGEELESAEALQVAG